MRRFFNLVCFLLLSSEKGTVSIPMHPSLPALQLIAALQKEKGGAVEGETDGHTEMVLKHCRVVI